jgi:hypothetical protein
MALIPVRVNYNLTMITQYQLSNIFYQQYCTTGQFPVINLNRQNGVERKEGQEKEYTGCLINHI